WGPAEKEGREAVGPGVKWRDRPIELSGVVDVRGTRRREVAKVRVIRALGVLHPCDQFRNEKIQIRVSLAVGVGHHVDWSPRDGHRKVAAVVQVEAAEEVLVGLSLAAVLRDDDAWHR